MTQVERTEAVITGQPEPQIHINAHARDLARKLDAVMAECDLWVHPATEAIAAIVEAER